MAIVEMLKLKLYGIRAEKQKILDALFDTRQIQLKKVEEIENTQNFYDDIAFSSLEKYRSRIEKSISVIEEQIEKLNKKEKVDKIVDVNINDFKSIISQKQEIEIILDKVEELINKLNDLNKEKINQENKINQLLPYIELKENFNDFKNTKHANILLGILPNGSKEFKEFVKTCQLTYCETVGNEEKIVKVFVHTEESFKVTKKLNELGFVSANFNLDSNASQAIRECEKTIKEIEKEEDLTLKSFCEYKEKLKDLKILYDYLSFCMDKEDAENKFRSTSKVFLLEAYLPKDKLNVVDKTLKTLSDSVEYEFVEVPKNEMPPTITKNNAVIRQFEFVTNMYSAPHYREFDPNAILALFFSIFFGFVMADIGYGIILTLFGFGMALKQKRQTGFKQLMNVIGIGGLFTIVFGVLFGSFFGLAHENWQYIPQATLPNPIENVTTLLIACLGAGIVQIMVSFLLKGLLLIKRKKVFEAICSCFAWDIFFIGLVLFVLDFMNIYVGFGTIGLVIAISGVVISVIGAFLMNKGFERLSKSFGSLYGIINLFSDILSYARLFGLMLSGAIIGSIVNDLASGFLTSPVTFIAGAIILAIGHSFNLAMGALGAYIHVARLQYIEFFSRFYEGEGELFVPFGTNFSYVNLIK